jgi:hypothetical protein
MIGVVLVFVNVVTILKRDPAQQDVESTGSVVK